MARPVNAIVTRSAVTLTISDGVRAPQAIIATKLAKRMMRNPMAPLLGVLLRELMLGVGGCHGCQQLPGLNWKDDGYKVRDVAASVSIVKKRKTAHHSANPRSK